MGTKMITVKALNGATSTYDSSGNLITFTNHVANVTIVQAKELLGRPRNQYVAFDLKANAMSARTSEPSIENLELEFIALTSSNKNLAALRNWLQDKMNVVNPALLNFQMERSDQMVGGQEAVLPDNRLVNSVTQQNFAGDNTEDDLDAVPVDGVAESVEVPVSSPTPPLNALDKASEVLRQAEELRR